MRRNRPELPLSGSAFSFIKIFVTLKGQITETGLALLEVLVALGLVTTVVLAIGANVVSVAQGHRVSSNYTIAVNLAQQKMEEAKARGALANGVATDYPAGSSGITFIRTLEIRDVSFSRSLMRVGVTLSWTEQGLGRSVAFSTYAFSSG